MNTIEITCFRIPAALNLDAITVMLEDCSVNAGRVTIECYGDAWSTYFSGCGTKGIREFLSTLDAPYLANRLVNSSCRGRPTKRETEYVERICKAVISACAKPSGGS